MTAVGGGGWAGTVLAPPLPLSRLCVATQSSASSRREQCCFSVARAPGMDCCVLQLQCQDQIVPDCQDYSSNPVDSWLQMQLTDITHP
ncbi:hypothetical protein J6590_018911 [Homalodisca vitripennis]|nr:hypothetical protein J6590_018911 [Homalodisca vitripennis]